MKKSSVFPKGVDLETLKVFFLAVTFEALASFFVLLSLPKSVDNAWLFGYSLSRIILISGMFLISIGLVGFIYLFWRKTVVQERSLSILHSLSASEKRFDLILNALSFLFLAAVFLLVLWAVTKDVYYLAYLIRFGPIIIFATLLIVQTIGLLLYNYPGEKRVMWYWSLLLGGLMVFVQEWSLVINNKVGNGLLILLLLCTAFYIQTAFRRNFSLPLLLSWLFSIALIWLVIYLEFFFIPKRFLSYKQTFLTFTPILMTTLAVGSDIVYRIISLASQKPFTRLLIFVAVFWGAIYAGKYYYNVGTTHAEQVNTTYEPFDDELAYMNFAIEARETSFRFTGTRNQMPIYPYVQALFYRTGMSPNEFFAQGKQVNIWLSLSALIVIFFVVRKFLSLGETINIILVTAFGLYALKSGYFMAELLYYSLSFFAYVSMCLLLLKPSMKLSILTGVLLGLGHLTKASVLPGFLLFLGVFILQNLITYYKAPARELKNEILNMGLKNLTLVVICFLIVVSSYIIESKRVYGSFFYNVNSTFYMWYDSYEEATNGTIAHGDGYGWPDMPADEIPSPGKYFREHSLAEIIERVRYGLHWQVENITYQYSFFNYPIFLSAFVFLAFLLNFKTGVQAIKENWALILFTLGYLFAYFSLYVWYSAISSMSRFLFALYLPLAFGVFIAIKGITGKMNFPLVKMTNILLFLMTVIDMWYLVSYGPFYRDFGS